MFSRIRFLLLLISLIFCSVLATAPQANAQSTPLVRPQHSQMQTPMNDAAVEGVFSELPTDHAIGSSTASLHMIIYASVTCPHCSHWFTGVWPDIKANYVDTGKVRVVFREMITEPAQLAYLGFQLANCALDNDYFSVIEYQMKEQENIIKAVQAGNGKSTYMAIAKLAGIKTEAEMNTCFGNPDGREQLNRSMKLATEGKISGVPAFIVNGRVYKESQDYLPLTKYFESLLGQEFSPISKP
ncbi:MAG: DsbA family protein [Robiginitomaculum sp.]|nr:DsbA family protein [Robiginitomaculum sp.]